MKLTERHIEEIKAAAERIGDFGRVTLIVSEGIVDVITEDRKRLQSGKELTEKRGKK